jgi:hypothetical protein
VAKGRIRSITTLVTLQFWNTPLGVGSSLGLHGTRNNRGKFAGAIGHTLVVKYKDQTVTAPVTRDIITRTGRALAVPERPRGRRRYCQGLSKYSTTGRGEGGVSRRCETSKSTKEKTASGSCFIVGNTWQGCQPSPMPQADKSVEGIFLWNIPSNFLERQSQHDHEVDGTACATSGTVSSG